jgi:hypothetical protein
MVRRLGPTLVRYRRRPTPPSQPSPPPPNAPKSLAKSSKTSSVSTSPAPQCRSKNITNIFGFYRTTPLQKRIRISRALAVATPTNVKRKGGPSCFRSSNPAVPAPIPRASPRPRPSPMQRMQHFATLLRLPSTGRQIELPANSPPSTFPPPGLSPFSPPQPCHNRYPNEPTKFPPPRQRPLQHLKNAAFPHQTRICF